MKILFFFEQTSKFFGKFNKIKKIELHCIGSEDFLPEKETLEAVSLVRDHGITVSLIGINLDEKGEDFGKKVAELGNGRFFVIKNLKDLDTVILEDYYLVN